MIHGGNDGQTSPEVPTGLAPSCQRTGAPKRRADDSIHARGKPVRVRIGEHDSFALADPGAGFEPAFLGPEPSVLPLDDPGMLLLSGPGGIRILTSRVKSSVPYQLGERLSLSLPSHVFVS